MKDTILKIKSFFNFLKQNKRYGWVLLPLVLFVLLIFILIFLFIQPPQDSQQSPTDSQTNIIRYPTRANDQLWSNPEAETEWIEEPEKLPGFVKKEEQANKTIIYTYASDDPKRPNITVRNPDNSLLFYREKGTKESPHIKIPLIKETYGDPNQIIQGSTYYGSNASIYFYGVAGLAFIVNTQTNETYEVHNFPSMSLDEYRTRYKDFN